MESPKGKFAFIVNAENKAEIRPLEVGDWTGDGWIINGGLKTGDRVVVEGMMKLSLMGPGAPVKISDGSAPVDGKGAPGGKSDAKGPQKSAPASNEKK